MNLHDSSSPTLRPVHPSSQLHRPPAQDPRPRALGHPSTAYGTHAHLATARPRPAEAPGGPRPAFLEMVGRLAGAYCPPLLSTDVVAVARAALEAGTGADMAAVEAVARAALDAAVGELEAHRPPESLHP